MKYSLPNATKNQKADDNVFVYVWISWTIVYILDTTQMNGWMQPEPSWSPLLISVWKLEDAITQIYRYWADICCGSS